MLSAGDTGHPLSYIRDNLPDIQIPINIILQNQRRLNPLLHDPPPNIRMAPVTRQMPRRKNDIRRPVRIRHRLILQRLAVHPANIRKLESRRRANQRHLIMAIFPRLQIEDKYFAEIEGRVGDFGEETRSVIVVCLCFGGTLEGGESPVLGEGHGLKVLERFEAVEVKLGGWDVGEMVEEEEGGEHEGEEASDDDGSRAEIVTGAGPFGRVLPFGAVVGRERRRLLLVQHRLCRRMWRGERIRRERGQRTWGGLQGKGDEELKHRKFKSLERSVLIGRR